MNFTEPDPPFDASAVVTILRVSERTPSRRWYITDSLDRKFFTKRPLVASLATRYRLKQMPCRPVSTTGFYQRELLGLELAEDTHTTEATA